MVGRVDRYQHAQNRSFPTIGKDPSMKKTTFALTATVLALTSASFVAGLAVAKGAAKMPVLSSLADAKWTPLMKEGPLPAFAPIEGDAMKSAHFAYLKLPAGFTSPVHSHTSDYWA